MIDNMTVGMENLPNVFIDNVVVARESSPSTRVRVTAFFSMYDKKAPENSWKNRDQIDLKIHIAFENRPEVISALDSGTLSLHNRIPHSASELGNPDIAQLDVAEWQPIIKTGASLANTFADGDYDKFVFNVTRTFDDTPNLNVYAACFVDNLGFGQHPVFSRYYGPMVGEKIFVGGQVNEMSFYFYYPDTNEEYGGPVHQKPDGGFMEGSAHTGQPHREVRLVTEENYKIQALEQGILDPPDPSRFGRELFEDPTFDPPDPSPYNPLASPDLSDPGDVTLGLTPTLDTGDGISEPNLNLAPTSTPIEPPPGY